MVLSFFKNKYYTPRYLGLNDASYIFFTKLIDDNFEDIKENILFLNGELKNSEELYQYLWFLSFKKFEKDTRKTGFYDNVREKIDFIKDNYDFSLKRFVIYINGNYSEFFTDKENNSFVFYEYINDVFVLIYKECKKSINHKVIEFVEEKHWDLVLQFYESTFKYYHKQSQDLLRILIKVKDNNKMQDSLFYNFFKNNYIQGEEAKGLVDYICKRFIDNFMKISMETIKENILYYFYLYTNYINLAKKYKVPSVNEFQRVHMILDELRKQETDDNEEGFAFKINLQSYVDIFSKSNSIFVFRLLTHIFRDGKFVSLLETVFSKSKNSSLFNQITNYEQPQNEFFTNTIQFHINNFFGYQSVLLQIILDGEKMRGDFFSYFCFLSQKIDNNLFDSKLNLMEELIGNLYFVHIIHDSNKIRDNNPLCYVSLVNGCIKNLIGTIEKILRNVLWKEKGDKLNVDLENGNLGVYLEQEYKNISDYTLKCLTYYLSKDSTDKKSVKNEKPGFDMRNKFMHNENNCFINASETDVFRLLYLTLYLLSDLFIASNEK